MKWIERIGIEKVLHICLCFASAVVAGVIFKPFAADKVFVTGGAWIIAFFIGFAKELTDEQKYHDGEESDWIADVFGATMGAIIVYLLII